MYTKPFNITTDGQHTVQYRSIDYAGNVEDWKSVEFKIDQTKPYIELWWENPGNIYVIFTADCSDATSGMDYVEFYMDDVLQFTDYAPPYEWSIEWSTALEDCEFYAYAYDIAGNDDVDYIPGSSYYISSDKYVFQRLTFPNNYEGYIGRFLISSGNRISFDDITPPVTTISFDPPTPTGKNGWYADDVEIILEATDDMSGVNATYYRLNEGEWETYVEPFTIESDDNYVIEYYSVDNASNVEDVKSAEFKIDQTPPTIDLTWEADKEDGIWYITFTATCSDATSGMDRVEFYMDDELVCTDNEAPYEWIYTVPFVSNVIGLIFNPQLSEENVTFFALIVIIINEHDLDSVFSKHIYAIAYDEAGNSEYGAINIPGISYIPPGIYMFQHLTFPNNYTGHMGKFFIRATFGGVK